MKLNHLNLTVTDVRAATEFLEKYFGMRPMGGNAGMGFMTDDDNAWGFVLTLMKASQVEYPGNFHVGFFVDSRETIDAVHRRLKADGFDVPPTEETGHSYGFYVHAPGGFTVELGA
jgi:lactoylglutathione lyase